MRTQKNKKRFTKNKKRITKNKKRINGGENTKKDKNINNNVTLNNFRAKKIRCSPKVLNELNMFSCYTDKSLFKLRDLWNTKHP